MKKDPYLEALMEGRETLATEMFSWMVYYSESMMQLGARFTIMRVLDPRAVQAVMQTMEVKR